MIQIFLIKGSGKLLVETHMGFYENINANTPLFQNVRKWLSSSSETDVTSSQIIDLKEIEEKNMESLSNFKIVTWTCWFSPKSAILKKLLSFVKNGGLRINFLKQNSKFYF